MNILFAPVINFKALNQIITAINLKYPKTDICINVYCGAYTLDKIIYCGKMTE